MAHTVVWASLSFLAACKHEGNEQPQVDPAQDNAPVHVTSAVAQGRDMPQTLALTGTLVPDQQSDVTPLVGGRVNEVMVERGSQVHAGDPLMALRDVDYRTQATAATAMAEQAQARLGIGAGSGNRGAFDPENTADVRSARANRDLAEDTLRRTQQLASSGSVSDQELQRAQAQAATAREQYQAAINNTRASYFQLQNARASADQQRRNVSDSTVRAPFDGEIAERRANVGEYVTTQRAVVTLVRTNPLRIELQIPQEQIPFVQVGQNVDVRVDAFPDRTFHGTIRYISAAVRQDSRSLVAEAIVPNDDHTLRPGIFVTARVNLNRRQTMVIVPPSAVSTEAGVSRVYTVENGRAVEHVVTVADRTPQEVVLSRGVEPNARVATDHLDQLSDGARVTQ